MSVWKWKGYQRRIIIARGEWKIKKNTLKNHLPALANCWLLHLLLSDSASGSTKFSGRGRGQVLERARVCGSNAPSCSSARASIGTPSLDRPSRPPRGEAGQGDPNESISVRWAWSTVPETGFVYDLLHDLVDGVLLAIRCVYSLT